MLANPDFELGPEVPDLTATLSSDEWRVLKRLCDEQLASRSRPKAARGWLLHGLARMEFPEWDWKAGKLYRVMNSLSMKGCCGVHTVKGEPGGYTWSPSSKGWRTYFKYERATGLPHPEKPEEEEAKIPWEEVFKVKSNPTVFVEIRMLKDAPPITGSDMKTYGPFREKRVYAIPKANARVFIKHGIAKATRKEAGKPTLKEMFKGEVLTPYIEAAVVKPLVEEVKLDTGKLADVFLELLKKAGVSLPSRFKGKFEEALDINKSYEENVKLIEAAAKRIILLEKTERVLGEIREARGE